MDFKYIKNISDNEGTILLYSQIGDSVDENGNYVCGISGSAFAYEMQYLQDKCKKINVRINSIGGSVLDGYSIVSAILNCKVPCDTYIDGLAASISGVIAMAGKKCYMADFGTLMLHNPSGGNDQNVLDLVKNTLVTIFKNRTKLDEDTINKMMDKETWLGAGEALNLGLVDEVVTSAKKIKISKSESLSNMAIIYNKLINKPNMEKITNLLKLSNEANEDTIVAEIEKKDTLNAELQAENDRLKAIVEAAEAKEKEAAEKAAIELKTKATELVENAIKEKKIGEAEKDSTIEMAVNNFEFVSNMISKIKNVTEAVKIFDAKNVVVKNGTEDRSEWNMRDWEKKDPNGLAKMKNETPEFYKELFNQTYKTK